MTDDLKAFYKQVLETKPEPKEVVDVSIMKNPLLNRDLLKIRLSKIDELREIDVTDLLRICIDQLCNDILNQDKFYLNLIQHHKFIDCFIKVLSIMPIDETKRLCANKLAYDYLTLADKGDIYIKQKLLVLSQIVNKNTISKLISLGLDKETSCNIAMVRHSSSTEEVNAKRLHFVLCNKSSEVMTEQMIVYIYETLFRRITPIFEAAMFEFYDDSQMDSFGDEFMTVYSAISLAVLTILNNMTLQDIRQVLAAYSKRWFYSDRPPVRFSLKCINGEYSRINYIVEQLSAEGIYIP